MLRDISTTCKHLINNIRLNGKQANKQINNIQTSGNKAKIATKSGNDWSFFQQLKLENSHAAFTGPINPLQTSRYAIVYNCPTK